MHNIFGDTFTFFSFGESHSKAIGGVIDGVAAGVEIDINLIYQELERRRGKGTGVSPRALREGDEVEWLSGVVNREQGTENKWVTLGTPIAFLIRNTDARPQDYEWLRHAYRPGHADRVYEQKYGIRDWRGGGRASARETAARVVAGSIAKQLLSEKGISIHAELIQVGQQTDPALFEQEIRHYQAEGDSIGGIIRCRVNGLQAGLGDPIFDKIQAHLAYAMLSINACKGFDYGSGFEGIAEPGSIANQVSGGLSGGITDGTELTFRCVFKPTPTTQKSTATIRPESGVFRSDACVAVRAVPVVEAMTALVLANFIPSL